MFRGPSTAICIDHLYITCPLTSSVPSNVGLKHNIAPQYSSEKQDIFSIFVQGEFEPRKPISPPGDFPPLLQAFYMC
jgi:hypothetical protein